MTEYETGRLVGRIVGYIIFWIVFFYGIYRLVKFLRKKFPPKS